MRDMAVNDERVGFRNRLVAFVAALICFVAILVWGVPGLDPSMWDEAAVVAGLRPPRTVFPGFWRFLAGWTFPLFGADRAIRVLSFMGAVVGAGCVYSVCLIIRQILALLIRVGQPYPVWYNRIAPFFSFVAAVCFGMSDPFWNICRTFSPEVIRLSLFLFVVHGSLRWFAAGGNWRLFPVFTVMGVLAAETPFAFLLPAVFSFAYASVLHRVMEGLFPWPERLPEVDELPRWRMFFLFLGGLALAMWLNASAFVHLGGIEANGWELEDIYFRYAGGYWRAFAGAATLIGWALGLSFAVLPFLVSIRIAPLLIRDDRPMFFNLGVMMFFLGVLAVMQTGAFPSTCFWTFTKDTAIVASGSMLAFLVFNAMVAFAVFGATFAFECQRTYLTAETGERPGLMLRATPFAVSLIVLALVFTHGRKTVEREMQSVVDEAVNEIVDECGSAKYLFTDGHLDPAIELAAKAKGKTLYTLNMMSGDSDWEEAIRTRAFKPGTDDHKAAETGIPVLLRVWAGEKKDGLNEAALQLGFEYWRRDRKPLPKASGMVARPVGLGDAEAKEGIARAKKLTDRILKLGDAVDKADPSPALYRAYSAVNWRLSRFARLRDEYETANSLDVRNGILKRMIGLIEQERLRTFMQMTPREGLQIALRRADFTEARRYAAIVLASDEEDPDANFGMGMSELMKGRLAGAERYLKACLKRRPQEPAVLNNLSIICRKQGRYKEAVDYAQRAAKLLPGSKEVRQTLEDALKKAP